MAKIEPVIPKVRAELVALARELDAYKVGPLEAAGRIRALVPRLYRQRLEITRPRAVESEAVTPKKIRQVWQLKAQGLSSQRIAAALGLNNGRVSEILHGRRTEDDP